MYKHVSNGVTLSEPTSQKYEFRVTAINDEGESESLVTDCAIKAKNPFGKHGGALLSNTQSFLIS